MKSRFDVMSPESLLGRLEVSTRATSDLDEQMTRRAGGFLLLLAGSIWILQGFDVAFAPESFMTGDPTWIIWGILAVVVGVVLLVRGRGSAD